MGCIVERVVLGVALASAGLGVALPKGVAEQAKLTTRAAAAQSVGFDVFLPLEHREALERLLDELHNPASSSYHRWLKPTEFNERFGPAPDKVAAIANELRSRGLSVSMVGPRHIHVTGSAMQVETTFGSELKTGVFANGRQTVAFAKPVLLPSSIRAADAVVTGLSGRIRMRSHSLRAELGGRELSPDNRGSVTGGYWFTDLKQAYSFPSVQAYTGNNVYVGVLMAGDYKRADMVKYFGHEKTAAPVVETIPIAGGAPYDSTGAGETALDLQQAGGMAPKAHLVLYNVPDLSDGNILPALFQIIESNYVDVLSMSFGGPEHFYSAEYNGGEDLTGYLRIYDDVFAQGNAQGITFVASSGDYGGRPLPPVACLEDDALPGCGTMQPDVETPASSPHVTAVGGTNLVTAVSPSSPLNSSYVSENADDDPLLADPNGTPATGAVWGSGGGNSFFYRQPSYQAKASTGSKLRTVPDVSLHMGGCPKGAKLPCGRDRSYDFEVWNGTYYGVVGTSASAPDFAGLVALKIERDRSRQGNINYTLYQDAAAQGAGGVSIFRENVPGYNGVSSTEPGYDRVLGIGTVIGLKLLAPPTGTPPAGVPQTPSNP